MSPLRKGTAGRALLVLALPFTASGRRQRSDDTDRIGMERGLRSGVPGLYF